MLRLLVSAFQAAIRRGTAVSMDHAQLVHAQWTQAARLGLSVHVLRVGTDDNIADLPSREARALADGVSRWGDSACVSLPGSEVAEGGRCRRIQAGHLEPVLGREHLGSLAGEVATVTCQPVLDEARVLQLRSAKCRCECVVLHQVPTSSKCAWGGE